MKFVIKVQSITGLMSSYLPIFCSKDNIYMSDQLN